MTTDEYLFEIDEGVGVITLNRPQRLNSITWDLSQALVDLLRGRYPDRYLVLDAPPIGASPDARILSELADTAVIVAGYGVDTVTAIKESVAVLEPGRLAGVVFNGVP